VSGEHICVQSMAPKPTGIVVILLVVVVVLVLVFARCVDVEGLSETMITGS